MKNHRKSFHKISLREKVLNTIKVFAPTIAIIMAGSIIIWPMLHNKSKNAVSSRIDTGEYANKGTSIIKGTIMGLDKSGNPYTLYSDKAFEYMDKKFPKDNTFHLINTFAEQNQKNGEIIRLNAKKGNMNRTKNLLYLYDGVSIVRNGNDNFYTENAHINLQTKDINTDAKVVNWGISGTSVALRGLHFNAEKNILILKGKSRIILLNDAVDKSKHKSKNRRK